MRPKRVSTGKKSGILTKLPSEKKSGEQGKRPEQTTRDVCMGIGDRLQIGYGRGDKKVPSLLVNGEGIADFRNARAELHFGDGVELFGLPGKMHGDLLMRQARSGLQLRTG